jgi:hypothetical protein
MDIIPNISHLPLCGNPVGIVQRRATTVGFAATGSGIRGVNPAKGPTNPARAARSPQASLLHRLVRDGRQGHLSMRNGFASWRTGVALPNLSAFVYDAGITLNNFAMNLPKSLMTARTRAAARLLATYSG